MGWDSTTNTMTDPISISDIAYAFGSSSQDLGTLISTGSINPWARYKPYRDSSVSSQPRTSLVTLGFGTPPRTETVQGLIDFYDNNAGAILWGSERANGWQYLQPRVNTTTGEKGRMFDFLKLSAVNTFVHSAVGYSATATSPFGTYVPPTPVAVAGGTLSARQNTGAISPTGKPDYYICVSDFNGLNVATGTYDTGFLADGYRMLYYGVLLIPLNSSQQAWETSYAAKLIAAENPIDYDSGRSSYNYKIEYRGQEEMRVEATLSASAFAPRSYKAYPFLASLDFAQPPVSAQDRILSVAYADRNTRIVEGGLFLYPIPGAEPGIVTLYADSIEVRVYSVGGATLNPGGGYKVKVYFTIENKTGSSITLPRNLNDGDLSVRIRNVGKSYNDARQTGEVYYSANLRWDDNNPGGTSDTTYSSFLNVPLTIPAGETVRIPSSGTQDVIVSDAYNIHIGFSYGGSIHSNYTVPSYPVVPTL